MVVLLCRRNWLCNRILGSYWDFGVQEELEACLLQMAGRCSRHNLCDNCDKNEEAKEADGEKSCSWLIVCLFSIFLILIVSVAISIRFMLLFVFAFLYQFCLLWIICYMAFLFMNIYRFAVKLREAAYALINSYCF